jgi:uncharacterized membrane protein YphA (DoxX/SURF4 family)
MENVETRSPSKAKFRIGWVATILPVLVLLFSGVAKLLVPSSPELDENLRHIGWRADQIPTLAVIEILCAVLFLIPRTAVIGAILVTGYMGGAIATHMRVGDVYIVQALLPILCWLGLWLREPRLWPLMPIRR